MNRVVDIILVSNSYLPVEKRLRALTMKPDIIVEMKVVPITMARINLQIITKNKSEC